MNHKEYLDLHSKLCQRMIELTISKQRDYSGGSEDAFHNVSRVGERGLVTTEQGVYTRLMDKIARLETFMKVGKYEVIEESILDTSIDLANYSLMLGLYLTNKEKK